MKKFNDIGFLILAVMMLFSIFFFTDALDMPNIYLVDRDVISFSDGWTWHSDGFQEKFHLPHYFDVAESEPLVIRNTIPDHLPHGAKLAIKSYMQSVIAKIDGETVYAVGNDSDKFLGKDFSNFWAVVDIKPEHMGKTIELSLFSHLPSSQGYAAEVIIASGTGLLGHIFSQKGLWNVWSSFTIILGILLILGYFLTVINKENNLGFLYLGTSTLFVGVWFLGDSGMLQLLTENTYFTTRITLILTLLSPISFGLYLRETLPLKKNRFLADFLLSLLIANAAICMVLEYLDILGIRDTLPISLVLIAIFSIYNIVLFLVDVFYYKNEKVLYEVRTIFIFMVFLLIETVIYFLNGQKGTSYFILIGATVYIIMSLLKQFKEYKERRKIREDKEYFEKIAYKDALTGGCNRAGYIRDLQSITDPKGITVVQADTDRLKYINDYFGHSNGDLAIIDTYKVLNNYFAKIGKTYRVGGDEFTVIIKNANRDEINRIIEQVKKEVDLIAEQRDYDFSISIGAFEYDASLDADVHATAVRADHNMYEDKKRLRDTAPRKMPVV